MKVFSHGATAIYKFRIFGQKYTIPENQWREIPEKTGKYLLERYKRELCDVSEEQEPGQHCCLKTAQGGRSLIPQTSTGIFDSPSIAEYVTVDINPVPMDRMMRGRTSHSRLNTIRRQRKLSKRARMGV